MNNLKNAAEVKAAANKKPYVKPDFEVINLEDTPKLLAASGGVSTPEGHGSIGNSALGTSAWGSNN
jgi:hypothetical protein